jgi:hypothetical protein
MTRQELDDRLVDYLFDELSAEEVTHFEASVTGYPELEAEVVAHQQTRHIAAALPQREMSARVRSAVMNEARAAVQPAEAKQSWLESLFASLMQPAMVTGMLVVVVGGTSVFVVQQEPGADEMPSIASVAQPALARDEVVARPQLGAAEAGVAATATAAVTAGGAPEASVIASAEKSSASVEQGPGELKAVSPAVSRLVEVEAADVENVEVASVQTTRSKKRSKAKRGRRKESSAGSRSVQVARGLPPQGLPGARSVHVAKAPPALADERSLKEGQAAARSAPSSERMQMAKRYSEEEAPSEDASPARPAPAPRKSNAKEKRPSYAEAGAADSEPPVKKDGDARAQGKRLVSEFERHLKRGDSAKAATALDKLAKIPGFEADAKRKRGELRSWVKKRASKRAKQGKGD